MSLIQIIAYKTNNYIEPFTKWFLGLDSGTRAIVSTRLKRVSLGNFGDCKILKQASGVWELRINYGAGYRIYFGKEGCTIVVLLIGGDKSSQSRDILKAEQYWLDYKGKMHENKKKTL